MQSLRIDTNKTAGHPYWHVWKPQKLLFHGSKIENLIGFQYEPMADFKSIRSCFNFVDAIEHRIRQWQKTFPEGTQFERIEKEGIIEISPKKEPQR